MKDATNIIKVKKVELIINREKAVATRVEDDENKSNNSVENLEWCTRKYNQEQSLAKTYLVENLITGEKYEIHNLEKFINK